MNQLRSKYWLAKSLLSVKLPFQGQSISESVQLNPPRQLTTTGLQFETRCSRFSTTASFKGEAEEQMPNKTTRVLYDGECKLCKVEIAGLKKMARKRSDVEFIDITSPSYDPALFSGVTYEQAMREMHVVGPEGQVYTQGDAVRQMYRVSGLGWLAGLTELPVVKDVCDQMYVRFAHYRLRKALARCDSESDRCSIKLHRLREKIGDSF